MKVTIRWYATNSSYVVRILFWMVRNYDVISSNAISNIAANCVVLLDLYDIFFIFLLRVQWRIFLICPEIRYPYYYQQFMVIFLILPITITSVQKEI